MDNLLQAVQLLVSIGGFGAVFIRVGRALERLEQHHERIESLEAKYDALVKAVYDK